MAFFVAPGCSLVKQRIIEATLQVIVGLNYLLSEVLAAIHKTSQRVSAQLSSGQLQLLWLLLLLLLASEGET